MATATGITIEEFERLPHALAHNHELVNGELVDVSGNTGYHNRLRDLLVALLRFLVEKLSVGIIVSEQEYDFDGNAHGPDVTLIGAAKVHLFDRKRRVQPFVPDLAIEIVSENDKVQEPNGKSDPLPQVRYEGSLDPQRGYAPGFRAIRRSPGVLRRR